MEVKKRLESLLGSGDCKRQPAATRMATPQVDNRMLGELELMGFPTACSIRALHFSGNSNLESAINWLLEHENEPDIDQLPLIPREINIECGDTPNEARNDIQGMRANAQESKPEESTAAGRQKDTSQVERELNADQNEDEVRRRIVELYKSKQDGQERERGRIRNQLQEDKRERIRAAKELTEAKRTLEENQRKRVMESRKADQEEEKKARERIRKRRKKAKTWFANGKPSSFSPNLNSNEGLNFQSTSIFHAQNLETTFLTFLALQIKPVEPAVSPEQLRDCLRNLKKNYKDDTAKVTRAFQILLKIIANIVKNPEEEKFRRIRLNNPVFKESVGSLQGGVEFLELCGFMKLTISGYLVMPKDKINMALLNAAGVEVASAMENPYFGLLSK
uniref:UBA domain-containing protein n=1 Tax=Oryza punctata TaxID=4537 RepID=A0A0E0LX49_ORYPU